MLLPKGKSSEIKENDEDEDEDESKRNTNHTITFE
jgi:hypothetical protein